MNGTLAQLSGDRPEAADDHRPEVVGAALDARTSVARAASALASHNPAAWPQPQRATVHRLLAVLTIALRDLDATVEQLRGGAK